MQALKVIVPLTYYQQVSKGLLSLTVPNFIYWTKPKFFPWVQIHLMKALFNSTQKYTHVHTCTNSFFFFFFKASLYLILFSVNGFTFYLKVKAEK